MIELLVALSLFAVALTIAMPRVLPERDRVRAAATEVQSALQRAQRSAVVLQHDVRVRFDATEQVITIHLDEDNDGVVGENEAVSHVALPAGSAFSRSDAEPLPWGDAAISFTNATVVFHRDGSASQEGGVYVSTIQEARGGARRADTRAVQVTRATGSVRCLTWQPRGWRNRCQ